MTPEEQKVLDFLATAWNAYLRLPVLHGDDVDDFCHAVHAAQNAVLARAGLRELAAATADAVRGGADEHDLAPPRQVRTNLQGAAAKLPREEK